MNGSIITLQTKVPAMLEHSGTWLKPQGGFNMTNNNTSGIYCIRNKINGHCYIGSAVNIAARWRAHKHDLRKNKHHSQYLQRSWNKYGEECFEFSVIETCFVFALIFREQHYINLYSPTYNIAPNAGSALGTKHTHATKDKLSASHMGLKNALGHSHKVSDETRLKISKAHMGNKHNLGHKATPETLAKLSACRMGHTTSAETREKLRVANLGRKMTPEDCAKISVSKKGNKFWLGKKHTPETHEKMRIAQQARQARNKLKKEQDANS